MQRLRLHGSPIKRFGRSCWSSWVHNRKRLQRIVTAMVLSIVVMGSNARFLEAPAEAPAAKAEMKGGLSRMLQTLAAQDLAANRDGSFHAVVATTTRSL